MPSFKKYTGTYVEVIEGIGLPSNFYQPNGSKEAYSNQIKHDLNRTCYLNRDGDVQGMQTRLADTTGLVDDEMSYTQGNFDGRVFTESRVKSHPIFFDITSNAAQEGTLKDYINSMGFTYVDDEGIKSGFAITYLRDDSDPSIPLNKRPYPFAIAIIKDVTKPPHEREVTYITHHLFLHALNPEDKEVAALNKKIQRDLESGDVMREVQKALNSKSIAQLIPAIIKGDSIALEPFLELSARLPTDRNLDDRDPKIIKLFDLFVMWARLAADKTQSEEKIKLMQELLDRINLAYLDINYFKDKSLRDVEEIVNKYEKNPLISVLPPIKNAEVVKQSLRNKVNNYQNASADIDAKLNKNLEAYAVANGFSDSRVMQTKLEQSFLRRNVGNILLAGVFLLAVVSVASILSGVLAPIGLSIAAGLATALAGSGVVVGGLAATQRIFKIVDNENAFQVNKTKVENIKSTADAKQQVFKEKYQEDLLNCKDSLEFKTPKKNVDELKKSDSGFSMGESLDAQEEEQPNSLFETRGIIAPPWAFDPATTLIEPPSMMSQPTSTAQPIVIPEYLPNRIKFVRAKPGVPLESLIKDERTKNNYETYDDSKSIFQALLRHIDSLKNNQKDKNTALLSITEVKNSSGIKPLKVMDEQKYLPNTNIIVSVVTVPKNIASVAAEGELARVAAIQVEAFYRIHKSTTPMAIQGLPKELFAAIVEYCKNRQPTLEAKPQYIEKPLIAQTSRLFGSKPQPAAKPAPITEPKKPKPDHS